MAWSNRKNKDGLKNLKLDSESLARLEQIAEGTSVQPADLPAELLNLLNPNQMN